MLHIRPRQRCSPEGPLILAVARLVKTATTWPTPTKAYALGRVFCGSAGRGQRVRCTSGAGGTSGECGRIEQIEQIEQLALPLGGFAEPIETVPAGNLVLVAGPANLIFKSGTLLDESLPSESCLQSVAANAPLRPLVRVSVRPQRAEDLPKLVAALRQLSACDPVARCRAEEWGEHVITGLGELHLSTCIGGLTAELAATSSEEAGTKESSWSCFHLYQCMCIHTYAHTYICTYVHTHTRI